VTGAGRGGPAARRRAAVRSQTALERRTREASPPADVISSCDGLGMCAPDIHCFATVVERAACARDVALVVGRVASDGLPAAGAGLVPIRVRGRPRRSLLGTSPEATPGLHDLASSPQALASLA